MTADADNSVSPIRTEISAFVHTSNATDAVTQSGTMVFVKMIVTMPINID